MKRKFKKIKSLTTSIGALAMTSITSHAPAQNVQLPPPVNYEIRTTLGVGWDASRDQRVAGYEILWGFKSGNYVTNRDVGNVTVYSFPESFPLKLEHFFVVDAYDAYKNKSAHSNQISWYEIEGESIFSQIISNGVKVTMTYQRQRDASYTMRFNYRASTNSAYKPFLSERVISQTPVNAQYVRETVELVLQENLDQILVSQAYASQGPKAVAPSKFRVRKL